MPLIDPRGRPLARADGPVQTLDEALISPTTVAVRLANHEDVRRLLPIIDRLTLLVLSFPRFTDGRAFSQARLARTALGYRGALRAEGELIADQAALLIRCGFDQFEVSEAVAAQWTACAGSMSGAYQRGYGPANRRL